MTDPAPVSTDHEILPPESASSTPPPVPQEKPGFFRRLFTSRRKEKALAIQKGNLEMVDLIRAIRSHLDRQEKVQTSVLSMLEKVPDTMERQHEVLTLFKQQLENGMENNRRLTDSMGNLNNTLSSMDESHRASAHTISDLIHRSRESEQLLREVMGRSERRMTALVIFFFIAVVALGVYFFRNQLPATNLPAPAPPAAIEVPAVVADPIPLPAPIVIAPVIEAPVAVEPIVEVPATIEPVIEEPVAAETVAPAPIAEELPVLTDDMPLPQITITYVGGLPIDEMTAPEKKEKARSKSKTYSLIQAPPPPASDEVVAAEAESAP